MRANRIHQPAGNPVNELLIGTCPGPPICSAVHTYLFVDGLDFITRSHNGAVGDHPRQLLKPGGRLYPTDQAHVIDVAAPDSVNASLGVYVRVRLRGRTVVWSDLMYPGRDGRAVEEVRFDLGQYVAEIERVYSRWGQDGTDVQAQGPCPSCAPTGGGRR